MHISSLKALVAVSWLLGVVSVTVWTLAQDPKSAADDATASGSDVLEDVLRLGADQMGIDGTGRLWAWLRDRGRVDLYDVADGLTRSFEIPRGAQGVDADSRWGVVAIADVGTHLLVTDDQDKPRHDGLLPHPAQAVAWIDRDTIAVVPDGIAHRIEIRNVETGGLVGEIGTQQVPPSGPGAAFKSTWLVDFHAGTGLLYTLESRTGVLEAFRLNGERRFATVVKNPREEELEEWLADLDLQARRAGDRQRPSLLWFRLALDRDGSVWTVRGCEPGSAQIVHVDPSGARADREVPVACCSQRLVVWGERGVFYAPPGTPGGNCVVARRRFQ